MTRRTLKSTTAGLLVISLLQPVPAMAQIRAPQAVPSLGEGERLHRVQALAENETCFTAGAVDMERCDITMMRAELEALMQNGLPDPAERGVEDDETAALTVEERIALLIAAIAMAETEASAAEVEIAEASEEIEAEEAAPAEAEAEAAPEPEQIEEAEPEVAEDPEPEAAEDTEPEAVEDTEPEAVEDVVETAPAEEPQEAAPVEESEAQPEVAEQPAGEAPEEVEPAAEDAGPVEETEAAGEDPAPAEQAEEDPAGETITAEQAAAERAASEEAARLKDAEIIAEQEAAQGLAAVAGTEAEDGAVEAEITTETLTEEAIRSSDQEFETPAARAARAESGDRGLSDLEKAGLLALGALAVGAVLQSGQRVATTSGDRVIVEDRSGQFQVLKDDDALIRQPGSTIRTERFSDGSTTTTATREDGSRIVTIRDASGRVLRRSHIGIDGVETLLIDDTLQVQPVDTATLPPRLPPRAEFRAASSQDELRAALRAAEARDPGRSFSLRQVRDIVEVRQLAPEINLRDITFRTASAAIQPSQAEQLREIGLLMREMIGDNPREIFLVEGYTDAVGDEAYNLLLSDRRAESVALALTEYFDVPPENMVVQGYGERFQKIRTQEAERLNRRVSVRRITTLIQPR